MPIRILIALVAIALAGFLGYAVLNEGEASIYILPLALLMALLLVFKPQMEWWWYSRFPQDLDATLCKFFESKLPGYYQQLDTQERLQLRIRTGMLMRALSFKFQSGEERELPEDLRALIALQAARVSLWSQQMLPGSFETVIVYAHPFPSPQYPHDWHSSELFAEDGVLLFNIERMLPGALDPMKHFNVLLYEWVRAYKMSSKAPFTLDATPHWHQAAEVFGQSAAWVLDAIGLPEEHVDPEAIIWVLAFEQNALLPKAA